MSNNRGPPSLTTKSTGPTVFATSATNQAPHLSQARRVSDMRNLMQRNPDIAFNQPEHHEEPARLRAASTDPSAKRRRTHSKKPGSADLMADIAADFVRHVSPAATIE